ncbi:MAG: hypothetical protein ACOYO9_09285 [Candidatus Nanopelagicales bacterium]
MFSNIIISNTLSGTVALIPLVTALMFSNRRGAAPADHAAS